MSIDWNNDARKLIIGAAGAVPDVGFLLSGLTTALWPAEQEDVWSQIKDEVEQLINQQLNAQIWSEVQADLTGLQRDIVNYTNTLRSDPTSSSVPTYWITCRQTFDKNLPTFQLQGDELLLLPLFAQCVNLYLALLKDGVTKGADWGWDTGQVQDVQNELSQAVQTYQAYAQSTYEGGYQHLVATTQRNDHLCEPFRSTNAYARQMTLVVLDFVNLWPYLDPSVYPDPVIPYLPREIYSDPVGTCDLSGLINLPSPPTRHPTSITVWAYDRLDAVQLTYPPGCGPDGVTVTARMGDQDGGTNSPPVGGTFGLTPARPVVVASGTAGDVLNSMGFTFADDSGSGTLGGRAGGGTSFAFSYPDEWLSSIHINGVGNPPFDNADCAVFGFRYRPSFPDWQQLDDNPAAVQIVADGRDLYQLHNTGDVWQYAGTPVTGWNRLDDNAATIAIAAGGGNLYQLRAGASVLQYPGPPTGWTSLDENPATIAIAADNENLYQLRTGKGIWQYVGGSTGWNQIDDNPATVAIVAGGGGQLYQLREPGLIFQYAASPSAWTPVPTLGNAIAIAGESNELLSLSDTGVILQNLSATLIPLDENPKNMAIAISAGNMYMLRNDGGLWYLANGIWTQLDDYASTCAIAASNALLYQLHAAGDIWAYTGQPTASG